MNTTNKNKQKQFFGELYKSSINRINQQQSINQNRLEMTKKRNGKPFFPSPIPGIELYIERGAKKEHTASMDSIIIYEDRVSC